MTHFLSCVIVLTVTKIVKITPAFVYELFQSCLELSFLRGNRSLNRNRDFKAALFQVASSVGFLSHFSRNVPSMFYKEAKSEESSFGMCPTFIFSLSGSCTR